MKSAELTIIILKDEDTGWYVGQIKEFPAAISQGATIDELKSNLFDALRLLLDSQKSKLKSDYSGQKIIRRKLQFA